MRHIPGSTCTFTSLNNTCPYMRVEKLFPLFLHVFFSPVINLVKLRGLFGVLFSTRACVCVCMSSASIHLLAFGGYPAHLVALRSDMKRVRFCCVCVRVRKVNAEARHSVALEMHILFSTTPCFPLTKKHRSHSTLKFI